LIEDQLRRIIRQQNWLDDIRINHYEPFKDVLCFCAGDDVAALTAMLMSEVLDELGTPNDFIGHAGGNNFIIVMRKMQREYPPTAENAFRRRGKNPLQFHGSGARVHNNAKSSGQPEKSRLMTLSVGTVSSLPIPVLPTSARSLSCCRSRGATLGCFFGRLRIAITGCRTRLMSQDSTTRGHFTGFPAYVFLGHGCFGA